MVPRVRIATVLAVLGAITVTLSAHRAVGTQRAHGFAPKVEFRILSGQLDKGLPKSFTFVFVNRSGHQLRLPRPNHSALAETALWHFDHN